MKKEDIAYIFEHAEVDAIIVDAEFLHLIQGFTKAHPNIQLLVDNDTDATEGELSGQFDDAVLEGLRYEREQGARGWDGLEAQVGREEDVIALAYTSGTTAKPKGVEFTHRGSYLAALANVIESGLNYHTGRCRYLWTLPMVSIFQSYFTQNNFCLGLRDTLLESIAIHEPFILPRKLV